MSSSRRVLSTADGAHDVTVTKAWVKGRNTITVTPVRTYDTLAVYQVCFLCAFLPSGRVFEPSFAPFTTFTPDFRKGGMTGCECFGLVRKGWAMLILNAESVTWGEDDTIEAALDGFPAPGEWQFPLIYTNSPFDTLGSKFYPAAVEDGVLTVTRDGSEDEASTVGHKFIKAFLVR